MMDVLFLEEVILFNLVEVTENNVLQIRELLEINKVARQFHRSSLDSRDLGRVNAVGEIVYLVDELKLIQKLIKLFPYIEPQYSDETPPTMLSDHSDGTHEDVSMIRIMAIEQSAFRYDITVHVVKNGRTVFSERKAPVVVSALDYFSKLPDKVQKVANLPRKVQKVARVLFTDKIKNELLERTQTQSGGFWGDELSYWG